MGVEVQRMEGCQCCRPCSHFTDPVVQGAQLSVQIVDGISQVGNVGCILADLFVQYGQVVSGTVLFLHIVAVILYMGFVVHRISADNLCVSVFHFSVGFHVDRVFRSAKRIGSCVKCHIFTSFHGVSCVFRGHGNFVFFSVTAL